MSSDFIRHVLALVLLPMAWLYLAYEDKKSHSVTAIILYLTHLLTLYLLVPSFILTITLTILSALLAFMLRKFMPPADTILSFDFSLLLLVLGKQQTITFWLLLSYVCFVAFLGHLTRNKKYPLFVYLAPFISFGLLFLGIFVF